MPHQISKVGDDYPLLFRFGHDEKVNGGRTLEESVMVGRMAESCGVDALDISIMTYASLPYMSAPPAMPHGFNQFPTKVIKEAVSIPVISVGRYEPAIAESALLNGCADFISFGRESIADPDLPSKVAAEKYEEIFPCIGCTQSCLGYLNVGGTIRCLVNPLSGLDGKVNAGNRILMIGGGMTGVETADFLAEHNKAVTIVEMRPDIALDEATAPRFFLIPRLKEHGVDWIVNATVKKILPDGVVYEQNGTDYTLGGYDTIVLALGVRPNNPLEEAARALGKEVYVIGDASQPAPANKATEAALDAVLKLG